MEVLAKTYRGEVADLFTYGSLAVVDSDGNIVYKKGNPDEIAFARSSAKLMQAMVPIYNCCSEYELSQKEIAQICASHSGEPFHIKTVRGILKKIGLDEKYLKCGAHYPFKPEVEREMKEKSIEPGDIHNNCSGKHAGMLMTSVFKGYSLDDYYKSDHPVQKEIRKMISRICDYPYEDILMGTDGCGVPVHALPIYKFAYGMARMGDEEKLDEELRSSAKKIKDAILKYPEYTSGTDRIDYFLISKNPGELVVKSGANGYYAGYFPNKKMGFALKTYDGNTEIRNLIVVALMKELGMIKREDEKFFDDLVKIDILNHRKEKVGETLANL
ncbi:MAG: asparaginase [Tissierellia bacterium]|nr:asparaginase [Tissierellia bacterium]